jgi:uncharacterized membrane protein YgdD (TMEM256/DUF423 family)
LLRKYTAIGAAIALLGVAFGAFGAHVLEKQLSAEDFDIFETGVRYQMYHGLGILIVALLSERLPSPGWVRWAARLLLAGVILFSGSLYLLVFSGVRQLGAVTPIGGVALLAGWLCLLLSARQK